MRFLVLALALLTSPAFAPTSAGNQDARLPRVLVDTDLGVIEIEGDTKRAPISAGRFLEQVDAGLYNNGRFHRTVKMDNQPDNDVKIEVIQAGIDPAREKELGPAIALERTSVTGLKH